MFNHSDRDRSHQIRKDSSIFAKSSEFEQAVDLQRGRRSILEGSQVKKSRYHSRVFSSEDRHQHVRLSGTEGVRGSTLQLLKQNRQQIYKQPQER